VKPKRITLVESDNLHAIYVDGKLWDEDTPPLTTSFFLDLLEDIGYDIDVILCDQAWFEKERKDGFPKKLRKVQWLDLKPHCKIR